MFSGFDLQLLPLEGKTLTPNHCLNLKHESKDSGPVSLDLIGPQIPVPMPTITRSDVEYSHYSWQQKYSTLFPFTPRK